MAVKDIYKIMCKCGEFYIGSTRNLKGRSYSHKYNCFHPEVPHYQYRVYEHFRKCGMKPGDICLIKIGTQVDKDRENFLIREMGATLNMSNGRSYDRKAYFRAYRKANSEKVRIYSAAYRESHREQARIYNAAYKKKKLIKIHDVLST